MVVGSSGTHHGRRPGRSDQVWYSPWQEARQIISDLVLTMVVGQVDHIRSSTHHGSRPGRSYQIQYSPWQYAVLVLTMVGGQEGRRVPCCRRRRADQIRPGPALICQTVNFGIVGDSTLLFYNSQEQCHMIAHIKESVSQEECVLQAPWKLLLVYPLHSTGRQQMMKL